MKVFLCGGMHSGWQDEVKAVCPHHYFVDPRHYQTADPHEYMALNLEGVRQSDVLFAYMEPGNPSGYDMALEIGVAKEKGLPIIYVDGLDGVPGEEGRQRYLAPCRVAADVRLTNLAEGAALLSTMGRPVLAPVVARA